MEHILNVVQASGEDDIFGRNILLHTYITYQGYFLQLKYTV